MAEAKLSYREALAAVDKLLIAGNGISSALIGMFGPDVFTEWAAWDDPNPDKPYSVAREAIQARLGGDWYPAYEMWQMWYACMSVSRQIRALEAVTD